MFTTETEPATIFATFRVRTTYSGPTDYQGSRITARGHGHSLSRSYDYAASNAHHGPARELAELLAALTHPGARITSAEPRYVTDHARGYVYDVDVRIAPPTT